ncbi:hypothetical protein EDB81DRAFT_950558 [Dactylonectria macrodidyma]|uniref:Uncharacterized protein n=1 Tax=Dactylonectria macrodidyma TaxID=307937 RepID=A0A9P9E532_9HYPO|nr:hypothetical protein EDB81DRAFT_950558 [Dactylonectria macrodidyma]
MNVIHGHLRDVPTSLSIEKFAKVAIVVDYYECHEVLKFVCDKWFHDLDSAFSYSKDSILYMLVSWVFRRDDEMKLTSDLIIRHSKGQVTAQGLPLPGEVMAAINVKREEAIRKLFSSIERSVERFSSDEPVCSFECSSIMLGALTRERKRTGLADASSTGCVDGYTITDVMRKLSSFQNPRWYGFDDPNNDVPSPAVHTCRMNALIEETLIQVERDLEAFQAQQYWHFARRITRG